MTPNQEKQKERAREEAEHHSMNSNVTGTASQPADAGTERSLETLEKEGYKFGFNGDITREGKRL